jgi:hypothetical protein
MPTSTCNKKCPFWKKYKEKCPNFIATTWRPSGGGQPLTVNDCSPKRTTLMLMDVLERLDGFHTASNKERNRQNCNIKLLVSHIGQMNEDSEMPNLIYDEAEVLQIEDNSK